jgi:hypothetical protein
MPTGAERLSRVNLKLSRAKEHLSQLHALVRSFLSETPYRVAVRRDFKTQQPIYFIECAKPIPESIPLVAGDAIQNLSTALDHLAYQLVCSDTNDVPPNPRKIYFPLADDVNAYQRKRLDQLKGAKPETIGLIDSLTPYRNGNDRLWELYRINNIEKHRTLLTVGTQAGVHMGQLFASVLPTQVPPAAREMLRGMTQFLVEDTGAPLTPGCELFRGALGGELAPLAFRFTVSLYEQGILTGKPVNEVVAGLTAVVENVIATLAPRLR